MRTSAFRTLRVDELHSLPDEDSREEGDDIDRNPKLDGAGCLPDLDLEADLGRRC